MNFTILIFTPSLLVLDQLLPRISYIIRQDETLYALASSFYHIFCIHSYLALSMPGNDVRIEQLLATVIKQEKMFNYQFRNYPSASN